MPEAGPNTIRLAVNVRWLVPGKIGGLEGAFRGMFDQLLRRTEDLEVTLLTSYQNHDAFADWETYCERIFIAEKNAEETLHQVLEHFDLLYCPFLFLEPLRPRIPSVLMVPDLQHLEHPDFFTRQVLAYRLEKLRASATNCQRVITISAFSRQHILSTYYLRPEQVTTTLLDCDEVFRVPADPGRTQALRQSLDLPEQYAVFPANAWPHKNHRGLFRALAVYRDRYGTPPLVALTGASVGTVDLEGEAQVAGVEDLIRRTGYLDKADLPFLYDGASLLLFVTLFEGFGIPVVEAMRRGVPVVASNTTSIPEIAGGHAWLADPEDPEASAEAMHQALSDTSEREKRVREGRAWVEQFGYARAADQSAVVFREVAKMTVDARELSSDRVRPKVFIVTPSYNQAEFLRDTIESVLAQDYDNLDYFVADGGSTDGSLEILKSYGDRVRWVSEPDGGQAAAINRAWSASDAAIVAWLNSDDTYEPAAVTKGVDYLLSHPEVSMVYGAAWYTDRSGAKTEPYPTKPFDRDELAGECFICQPATFLWRDVFQVIDLPDPKLRFAMDYDLWIRLSEFFGVGFLDEYLATSRMYAENKTLGERDGVYQEIMEVSQRHFGKVASNWLLGYASFRWDRIARRFFWFLPSRVQRLLSSWFIYRNRSQGAPLSVDGWAGKLTLVRVEPDLDGWVTIEADSPVWPQRGALRVQVEFEGAVIHTQTVSGRGPFAMTFEVPSRRLIGVNLLLRANKGFTQSEEKGGDSRLRSFRVAKLRSGRTA